MTIKEFQKFLEEAQKNLTSNKESETGCFYMDALKTLYPSVYNNLPSELNTALNREHTPLLFEYLIKGYEE